MASTEGSNVAYIYYHKLTIEPQNPSSKKIILGYFYENLYENLWQAPHPSQQLFMRADLNNNQIINIMYLFFWFE